MQHAEFLLDIASVILMIEHDSFRRISDAENDRRASKKEKAAVEVNVKKEEVDQLMATNLLNLVQHMHLPSQDAALHDMGESVVCTPKTLNCQIRNVAPELASSVSVSVSEIEVCSTQNQRCGQASDHVVDIASAVLRPGAAWTTDGTPTPEKLESKTNQKNAPFPKRGSEGDQLEDQMLVQHGGPVYIGDSVETMPGMVSLDMKQKKKKRRKNKKNKNKNKMRNPEKEEPAATPKPLVEPATSTSTAAQSVASPVLSSSSSLSLLLKNERKDLWQQGLQNQ
ncbi:hypothetical protein BGZ94_003664 [Podila epigama]|nr:hypothetical protein BGZ94_003664 [Podila epigama]